MFGLRQVLAGAWALVAVAAAPASAQLVPATPPGAPGTDSPSLGGDVAHRNAWAGAGLRPPLEVAWTAPASAIHAPIVVGSRVFVQTTTGVAALAAADGKQLWSSPLAGPFAMAADGARLYLAGSTGVAALDAATGSILWAEPDPGASGAVAVSGSVLTGNAAGELVARSGATGAVAWRTSVGIVGARPAVAGLRAYATSRCRGASVDVILGIVQWETGGCSGDTATRTLLTGGLVIGEDGPTFAASDGTLGAATGGPGTAGAGLLFASPLRTRAGALVARDGSTFAERWTWNPPLAGRLLLRPAVADGTVWQVHDAGADGLLLGALDAATGAERWTGFLPGNGTFAPAIGSAVAFTPGLLLVPTAGGGLAALRNAPAGPLSVRATFPRNVVTAGTRTTVSGQVISDGHGLVGPRAVYLQGDAFPFDRRFKTLGGALSRRAGFEITAAITRNTRLRLVAEGVKYPATPVYAQPPIAVSYQATDTDLVVLATLKIAKQPGLRRGGRVALYRLKAGALVAERIGTGRSRANGTARFNVTIPPDLSREDRVVPCLKGSSKRGFGAPNALDRECGAETIDFGAEPESTDSRGESTSQAGPTVDRPDTQVTRHIDARPIAAQTGLRRRFIHGDRRIQARSSSVAALSLYTGTGSAMPLKRFIPASENE